jgi:hypothetical protein
MSRLTELEAQYNKVKAQENQLFQELEDYKAQGLDTSLEFYQNKAQRRVDLSNELIALSNQISRAKDEETTSPAATASDNVQNSGVGVTQNPPTPATVLVVPESQINVVRDIGPAEQSENITRTGGQAVADDAPGTVKKISQTQSVSPTDGRDTPQASGSVGAGASGDDSGTKQNTLQIIKAATSTKIVPRGNALDQYPSYTYNITWYIMEKNVYKTFFSSAKKSLNGLQILMRSGGAPATTAGSTTTTTGPNSPTNISGTINSVGARNSFFNVDYYIDNLTLESLVMGPYNRSPHNVTRLRFTVTEPNGITLINNIWQAVNQLYQTTKLPYSLAQFCLAVRFYAYDSTGNLIPTKDNTNTDTNAIIERFYPFTISDIKFRVANKQVEYEIEGLPLTHYMGFGQNLGVIKQQVELSGTSVGQVLGGESQGSNPVPASDGRSTVTTPETVTVSSGTGQDYVYDDQGKYLGTF